MSDVVIGIDGGGTSARAVVTTADGREIARLGGAAGLVNPADPGAAADTVAKLARDVMSAAGCPLPAAVLCCGLAGAGREQEREVVRVALTLAGVAAHVMVIGDAEAAMANAFGTAPGVLLIAGTGSIAWARSGAGEMIRIGGWGQHLGDEGSGYAIGRAALHAVARAADGRAPATSLTDPVLTQARLGEPAELITWVAHASKRDVAALTPLVLDHARAGDSAAAAIRDAAVAELALLARTAARRAGLAPASIALHGGLISPDGPLRDAVIAALPTHTVLHVTVDAAAGAASLARAALT